MGEFTRLKQGSGATSHVHSGRAGHGDSLCWVGAFRGPKEERLPVTGEMEVRFVRSLPGNRTEGHISYHPFDKLSLTGAWSKHRGRSVM